MIKFVCNESLKLYKPITIFFVFKCDLMTTMCKDFIQSDSVLHIVGISVFVSKWVGKGKSMI
jgi:hypothetical protein